TPNPRRSSGSSQHLGLTLRRSILCVGRLNQNFLSVDPVASNTSSALTPPPLPSIAVLPLIVVSLRLNEPCPITPPPESIAVLPMMRLLVRVTVPPVPRSSTAPPSLAALLPLNVE